MWIGNDHLSLFNDDLNTFIIQMTHIKYPFGNAENEKELFDEDFYCIPKRVFDMCHLDYESIQIIVEQGQMVITNPQYVLSYLGKDMITCLLKQNVDLGLFAKDLVDLLNEQTIEEAV